jgi:hypothetical protein
MGEVLPLPNRGDVFADSRGEGRTLRVSLHDDEHTLVLSMWQLGQCRATFRLPTGQVPALVHALVSGLTDRLGSEHDDTPRTQPTPLRPELADDEPTVVQQPAAQPEAPVTDEAPIPASDGNTHAPDGETTVSPPPPAVFLAPPPNPA